MASVFRPSTPADESELIEFLARVFSLDRSDPFLNPQMMRWKYWAPRTDITEPRSYVIERDGRIAAHAGLWPVAVRGEKGVHMIDWASAPNIPGVGVSLLQRLLRTFDFVYSIGGSEMTMEVLPKVGFRKVAEAHTWVRPIRPFRQMLAHQTKDMRLPVRFARNLMWSRTPSRASSSGWTAVPAAAEAANERDSGFFDYLNACPATRCLSFRMTKDGIKQGSFALTNVHKQARIVGVWLHQPTAANLRIAFELAQHAALQHTDACEIIARGTTQPFIEAAAAAGMRTRETFPVLFYKKGGPPDPLPLEFQVADNDCMFLEGRGPSFLT